MGIRARLRRTKPDKDETSVQEHDEGEMEKGHIRKLWGLFDKNRKKHQLPVPAEERNESPTWSRRHWKRPRDWTKWGPAMSCFRESTMVGITRNSDEIECKSSVEAATLRTSAKSDAPLPKDTLQARQLEPSQLPSPRPSARPKTPESLRTSSEMPTDSDKMSTAESGTTDTHTTAYEPNAPLRPVDDQVGYPGFRDADGSSCGAREWVPAPNTFSEMAESFRVLGELIHAAGHDDMTHSAQVIPIVECEKPRQPDLEFFADSILDRRTVPSTMASMNVMILKANPLPLPELSPSCDSTLEDLILDKRTDQSNMAGMNTMIFEANRFPPPENGTSCSSNPEQLNNNPEVCDGLPRPVQAVPRCINYNSVSRPPAFSLPNNPDKAPASRIRFPPHSRSSSMSSKGSTDSRQEAEWTNILSCGIGAGDDSTESDRSCRETPQHFPDDLRGPMRELARTPSLVRDADMPPLDDSLAASSGSKRSFSFHKDRPSSPVDRSSGLPFDLSRFPLPPTHQQFTSVMMFPTTKSMNDQNGSDAGVWSQYLRRSSTSTLGNDDGTIFSTGFNL